MCYIILPISGLARPNRITHIIILSYIGVLACNIYVHYRKLTLSDSDVPHPKILSSIPPPHLLTRRMSVLLDAKSFTSPDSMQ